jgi:hypothetical protein
VRTAGQSAINYVHYDELFAPTTARGCGPSNDERIYLQRKRRRSRMCEQLVRVPIRQGWII